MIVSGVNGSNDDDDDDNGVGDVDDKLASIKYDIITEIHLDVILLTQRRLLLNNLYLRQ